MPDTTAKKKTTLKYVVMKGDGLGVMFPMTHSTECEGAICSLMPSDKTPIALFNNRAEAKKAIRISVLNCVKQLYIQPARF